MHDIFYKEKKPLFNRAICPKLTPKLEISKMKTPLQITDVLSGYLSEAQAKDILKLSKQAWSKQKGKVRLLAGIEIFPNLWLYVPSKIREYMINSAKYNPDRSLSIPAVHPIPKLIDYKREYFKFIKRLLNLFSDTDKKTKDFIVEHTREALTKTMKTTTTKPEDLM